MPPHIDNPSRIRLRLAMAVAIVTPLGFATKFWMPDWLPQPIGRWCLLYGAAVLYEVFWVLVLAITWPRMRPWSIGSAVFVATCLLEFLQLVHVEWLDAVRSTFLGAALLGNGFDLWDFPHYALGSTIGACACARLHHCCPR